MHTHTNLHCVWLIDLLFLLLLGFFPFHGDGESACKRKKQSQQRKSNIKYKGVAFHFDNNSNNNTANDGCRIALILN